MSFDNKGQVKKIATGKKHTVFLTDDGKVYSYGYGEYGALGHGGLIETSVPKPIARLSNRNVLQLACGEFHTLALTQDRDMYAWGRGFEG
jgi:alpha-tubulin suppressor-like RCC1 family protein